MSAPDWHPFADIDPGGLREARLQAHYAVQWLAVRKTVGEMSVPEQIGKMLPSGDFTMNAPELLNALCVSANP